MSSHNKHQPVPSPTQPQSDSPTDSLIPSPTDIPTDSLPQSNTDYPTTQNSQTPEESKAETPEEIPQLLEQNLEENKNPEKRFFAKAAKHKKARVRKNVKKLGMFLAELEKTPSVNNACKIARIEPRWIYRLRNSWPAFADLWEKAQSVGFGTLESEAFRRARDGTTEPVVSKGEVVTHVQRYSDNLTMFLLKAHNPAKYRDQMKLDVSGQVGIHYHIHGVERDPPAPRKTIDIDPESATNPRPGGDDTQKTQQIGP